MVRGGVRDFERFGVNFYFRMKVVYDFFRELGDEWVEYFVLFERFLGEFDVILIVIGVWRLRKLKVLGVDFFGVYDVFSLFYYIKMVRIGYYFWEGIFDFKGKYIVVIGVGYMVVDVVIEGRFFGVEKIMMVYRRGLEYSYVKIEIRKFIEEGVEFIEFVIFVRIIGDERV